MKASMGLKLRTFSPVNFSIFMMLQLAPQTIYGSYSWSPRPFVALHMVPQTNYGAVVGPPLSQLVPCIIQHLLLFIET